MCSRCLVVSLIVLGVNNVYMQGITGQTLGKRIVGTRVVSAIEAGVRSSRSSIRDRPVPRTPARSRPGLDRLRRLYPAAVAASVQLLVRLDRQDRRPRPLRGHLAIRERQPGQATTRNL